jgi:putative PEP-CTERM system histidine kinase
MANPATGTWLVPLAAAGMALALAGFILIRPWAERFHRALAAVLFLTAVVEAAHSGLLALTADAVFFRHVALAAELLRMAALFALLSSLMGRSASEADPAAGKRARIAAVIALLAALASAWSGMTVKIASDGSAVIADGRPGRVLHVVLLLGLVLALAQLESVLRASRDPFRFRIKFVLVGLGALAGFELYVTSQTLLLGGWHPRHAAVGGFVALFSVGLVAYGMGRMRLARTLGRVAVSPQMVYGSFTLLGVGLYLIGIGLLGGLLRRFDLSISTAELLVFVSVTALVVGVASRSVRARFRGLVARHFLRSRYDYRTKWLEVTDAFRPAETVEQILDRLLDLLARTFGTPRLSIWMRFDADDALHQVRSVNTEPAPAPMTREHPLVKALAKVEEPLEVARLQLEGDAFAEATRLVLVVPLRGAGELIGFIALGPPPGGAAYDTDDLDLLRAVCHHSGVLLAHAQLGEDRQASAELDALNRFAAFYLHDLKNLTARLSLVAQNAAKHGDDPEFRAAAMKTVGRTAGEMAELITQLSLRSPAHGRVTPVDLATLVETTIASLGPDFGVCVEVAAEPPGEVLAVPQQLQQVVLNLVMNAKQASERAGGGPAEVAVRCRVGSVDGRARLEVADHGPGIPPERLRNLFQPFQSSSPGGLGIGLYESKRIVESYRGTLRVESGPQAGARVIVELPTLATSAEVGRVPAVIKETKP